jgi:MFS family permease
MTTTRAEGAVAPERAGVTPLQAWMGLAILILITFLGALDRQIISLMVGGIKATLHLSDSQIGVMQGAAFGIALLVFSLPFGYLADRFSRTLVLCVGVIIWSLAAAAGGVSNTFNTLMAARIGVAIGEAALIPAASSLIGDLFPRHKLATVFSIFHCGTILGGATALGVGGAVLAWAQDGLTFPLIGHLVSWQVALLVTGLPGVAIAFLVFLVPEQKGRGRGPDAAPQAPWRDVFRFMTDNWAYLTCYMLGFSMLYASTLAQLAWLPTILQRSYGWTPIQVGGVLMVFTAVLGVSGQLVNGMTVDRMLARGRKDAHLRYYGVAAAIVAVCAVAAQYAPTAWIFLAFFAPIKFFMNYAGVHSAALQMITPSHMRARVAAVNMVFYGLVGGTGGPSIVAYFTDHVFRDESKVINSLSLTYGVLAPTAALLFWLGAKPMRAAVIRAEALGR